MTIDITKHILVSKHTKISEAEKKKLFEKYFVLVKELPKIMKDDPAISKLNAKVGDIIKIERKSKTALLSEYYRVVVDG